MDARQENLARTCWAAAYDNTRTFPDIVATLAASGFEGYAVDYRRATARFYLCDGGSVEVATPVAAAAVSPRLDIPALKAAIAEAQTLAPGYTYGGFCEKAKAAACMGYLVSFPGRRAVYFGRDGELHVEHFPNPRDEQ